MNAMHAKLLATLLSAGLLSIPVSATQPGHDKDYKSLTPHAIAKRTHERKPDDLSLTCNDAKKTHTLSALLAALNPSEPHTVRVSGACTGNVSIVNFAQITLLAESGASVTDASGGLLPVIDVERTRAFEMQGFTINGQAVVCADHSSCFFSGNTFQDSADAGVSVQASEADFLGDVMQRNDAGLQALFGALIQMDGVKLTNNAGKGAFIGSDSTLIAINTTSQDNPGQGLRISSHSFLNMAASVVSNNGSDGIYILVGSDAVFDDVTIRNNGASGVSVRDLSMIAFPGPSDVTGNLGGTDVVCLGQFPAARDTATSINGGTSNCIPE